ncbi:MAG: NAD-dependent epimerase [Draconibacterium sp.]
MKILITGTAGFIGSFLAKKLLERGDTVVGIDNINDYYDVELKYSRLKESGISREAENWNVLQKSSLFPNYSFIRMNLEDKNAIDNLFEAEKFDAVCNLAAQAGVRYSLENPTAYINSNIVGFVNILEACRNHPVQHLVYASSSSVYGNSSKMPLSVTDSVDNPVSLYAATKKSNELMAHTYSHLFGLPTTGLRFFTVYGPWGRPDMAPIIFASSISQGKPIKVFNHGDLERDFTYIDDIVEGVVRVIDSPPKTKKTDAAEVSIPYSIYNIGNGNPVKLMDFIETMENAVGKKAIKEFYPMQPGDVYKTFADVSALKENFNYTPDTSIQKGLTEFIRWFKSYYSDKL